MAYTDDQCSLASRSFLVHLRTDADIPAGRVVGRVEHVPSGDATHFQSIEELLVFIARIGLHTGECDLRDDTVSGVAVDTAAQVAAHAAMSEVLVSRTVKDLVAGSGLRFEDHGEHALDGVPGDWRLFAVERGVSRIPNS